jgi:hypothetical protein
MPLWTPKNNAVDTTLVENNVLTFIRANQSDALLWANGGALPLKPFNFLTENLANLDKPNVPTLMVTGKGESVNYKRDVVEVGYRIDFESIVFSGAADTLPTLTNKYALALKSMLANITPPLLLEGLDGEQTAEDAPEISVNYGEIGVNEQLKGFIQVFQITAKYSIGASAYA